MFEEALAGGGENYTELVLMEVGGSKKQKDRGRHVCPWAVCVGQSPGASPLVALVMVLC